MLQGRVAPSTVVIGQTKVRRTEVGGGDGDDAGKAPFGVIVASHLVARPTAEAIVE